MEKLLLLFIDALGYEMINPRDTPFLYKLASKGSIIRVKPILGYSDSIKASLFTGTYPDKHGYWMMFKFNPSPSLYRIYKPFSFLDAFPGLVGRGVKSIVSLIADEFGQFLGLGKLGVYNIPYRVVHMFKSANLREIYEPGALPVETIFDTLRRSARKFTYIRSDETNPLKAVRKISCESSLIVVYLHYLDIMGHLYGIDNMRFKQMLRSVDYLSRKIINEVRRKMGDIQLVVLSDHGLIESKNYINLWNIVIRKEHGKDYLIFLSSTMVHSWYFTEKGERIVREMLEKISFGKFLSEKERRDLRVWFNSKIYGDYVFLLEPTYQIFPNYISRIKPKAMHAYHPSYKHQHGIFICENRISRNSLAEMPDITATILKILGLKKPKTCEGKSLV
jgi:predicted AlkP superfamily pyrophosphatase or phosphodiesterase